MGLFIQGASVKSEPSGKSRSGHARPMALTFVDLSKPGRIRVGHMMTLFSVSHSTFYKRIEKGLIPEPDGRDGSRPFWLTETVAKALKS